MQPTPTIAIHLSIALGALVLGAAVPGCLRGCRGFHAVVWPTPGSAGLRPGPGVNTFRRQPFLQRTVAMNRFQTLVWAVFVWFTLNASGVHASTGLTELAPQGDFGPVTVFYPSSDHARKLAKDSFTLQVAEDGSAVDGNQRLIVFSHGTGSPPWVLSDLANRLVQAGFVVAIPQHRGDNRYDSSKAGPESWKLRPVEVSHAIDMVAADSRWSGLIDTNKVGMWGFSAGGHTALTLAGGQWSAARLRDHCETHIADDFAACTGGKVTLDKDWMDGIKQSLALFIIRLTMGDAQWYGYTDPRIRAIVAAAPWAANFDLQSLASPAVPLGIVQVQQDAWLAAQLHSAAVLAVCKTCEVVADLPDAGHGTMLSPFPQHLPLRIRQLVIDPPMFDRAAEVAALLEQTTRFFQRHLLDPLSPDNIERMAQNPPADR